MRAALALLWLLHFFPQLVLARLGRSLGLLLYWFDAPHRRVGRINLKLCFPERSERERERILRAHFRALGRALLEQGIAWWSPKERLHHTVRVEGLANWRSLKCPVILLAPHFVGLDIGGIRLASEFPLNSMYRRAKNETADAALRRGRTRFGMTALFSRQDGVRPVIKSLLRGEPFYYLPDQDFGKRESVFVPFFGVPAATVPALGRMARLARAKVVPCVTRQLAGGYVVELHPAWDEFPSADLEADTRRMNLFIEERVREMPEQYFWLHKRFKTRPPGEKSFYDERFA
jgi:KDO2-lipid IV(A) lauroyltransferase